ncbi:IS256 family transposase [Salinibacter sp.]|uniref:IS256 family transposase n=1 Tax=Salinibacter sp. TaxID=2065818 RepID=UPI0021E964F5|nr:IS256 family transposase [Salinibacter sp.]
MTLSIDLSDEELEKILLGDRGRDLLMEKVFNQVLEAEMTEHLGADRYERNENRSGYRNGSYERELTTRVGQLTLEVPRCKDGSFSTKLFQRYQRSEKALVLALMEMVVQGVSTRRVKKITTELCGREFSKSTVSRLTKQLDEQVKAWDERPLDQEYPFLVLDAMHVKVRRQGGVRSTAVLLAVGISEKGQREILGLHTTLSETESAWKSFLEKLSKRGLAGVEHVTSDRDRGLKEAIRQKLPGVIWTPCHAHLRRNVLDDTPEEWRGSMKDLMDEVLQASSQTEAFRIFEEILEGDRRKMVTVANGEEQPEEVDAYNKLLEEAAPALATLKENLEEATAVLALPDKYRRRLRTTNMIERLIEEVRRREKVIRIFPNMDSAWRLIGAVLAEKHEEWSTGRKYLDMAEFRNWKKQASRPESEPDGSTERQPAMAT